MIYEKVTITPDKIVVSYSGDDISLTPEMEAKLAAFWKGRIERITAEVLGWPYPADATKPGYPFPADAPGTSSGNVESPADVPAREREVPKWPYLGFPFPFVNT